MHSLQRMQLLGLALLGLLVFAQLPRMLSICQGADGALRAGLSCQCSACDVDDALPAACGCGDSACPSGAPASQHRASLQPRECCSGFQLALQPQLLRPSVLTSALQCPAIQVGAPFILALPALAAPQVVGRVHIETARSALARMVRSVVLRA